MFHNDESKNSGRHDDASARRLSLFLLYSFLSTIWDDAYTPLITCRRTKMYKGGEICIKKLEESTN